MAYFSGRVISVYFKNEDQCFYIAKMSLDGKPPKSLSDAKADLWKGVVAKGYVPGLRLRPGVWFGFQGKWVDDPKYGLQLSMIKAPIIRGRINPDVISEMLLVDGTPKRVVSMLQKKFGDDLHDALKDVQTIKDGLGVADLEAEYLVGRWKALVDRLRVLETLNGLNLPRHKVGEIWATFGDDTEKVLSENPWKLAQIPGIPFEVLDTIAETMELDLDNDDRRLAAVVYAARKGRRQGDLFITSLQLTNELGNLLPGDSKRSLAKATLEAHRSDRIVLDRTTRPGLTAIYDPWTHQIEEESAQLLRRRVKTAEPDGDDIDQLGRIGPMTQAMVDNEHASDDDIIFTAINECAHNCGFKLSDEQAQGLYNALTSPVSILTGLPGTGKSTSMKVFVKILQQSQTTFLMAAPTGIAAKRLSQVAKGPAFTLHRAFGARGGTKDEEREATYKGVVGAAKRKMGRGGKGEFWGYGPNNPHPANVVIVDEFSMVDQHLMWRILSSTRPSARLVFVGDAAQLPSVGPGNVLRELIRSEALPVVSLTKIFRQDEASDIVLAAHSIHRGEVPEHSSDSDFTLLRCSSEQKVLDIILKLSRRLYQQARKYKGDGVGPTFQVLSPRHGGTVGVTNLNSHIRSLLNPAKTGVQEMKVGKEDAREGDRVMVVKNDYELGVFNGDVGKIRYINRREKLVVVEILDNPPRPVNFSLMQAVSHLRLAYACTVHKYQGLEVDTVVMPLVSSFGLQLQRNLLYTAITRARKKVILVGSEKALARAVRNNKENVRNTLLFDRIVEAFSAEEDLEEDEEDQDQDVLGPVASSLA